jgi:hypothetical protein
MPSRIREGGEIRVKTDFFGDGSMIRLREVSKEVSGSCVMPPGLFSVERKSEIGRVDWGKPRNSFERTNSRKAKGDAETQKGDAAQSASIEFFHWVAIALNRRRHERIQRIDNNGRRRMSANMLEVARSKTPSWPLVC